MRIDPSGMNDDWFENELTGQIYYNSGLQQGAETQLGDCWNWIGPNGMFGQSDANVLLSNQGLTSNGVSLDMNNLSASFTGEQAKEFMNKMGFDFQPKVSYEAIRHDFPVSTLLPNGASANVELQSGTRVITASTYVKRGCQQNAKIQVFDQSNHSGASYTRYSRTTYSYVDTGKRNGILQFIGLAYGVLTSNHKTMHENITTVYGWNNNSDQRLNKYKERK